MDKVLLALHLMIAAGLVGVVLLQRSEGGGLGMGSGSSGFMTGRGTANFLTRLTAGLAAAFFVTSIALTLLARHNAKPRSPLDLNIPTKPGATAPLQPGAPLPEPGKASAPAAPVAPPTTPAPAPVPSPTPAPPAATPAPAPVPAPTKKP